MPIELRTQRDGSLRDTWYGRYEINGKRFYLNLGVKWAGTPPESRSLRDTGDSLFERSAPPLSPNWIQSSKRRAPNGTPRN